MAGIVLVPLTAAAFVSGLIIAPLIPGLTLIGMPVILVLSAVFNLNISNLNWWYTSTTLIELPWWNILYAVLSVVGILPSFVLLPPGLLVLIIGFLIFPIWSATWILIVAIYAIGLWLLNNFS